MKYRILVLIATMVLFACNSNKFNIEVVNLEPEKSIDNLNDTIYFRQMGQILYKNNRFYLLDSDIRDIIICDSSFRFVNRISKRGRGPGEYLYPSDLNLNNYGNIVLRDHQSIFKEYDQQANFINQVEASIQVQEGRFVIDKSNSYYTCSTNSFLPILKLNEYGDTTFSFGKKYNYPGNNFFTKLSQNRHLFETKDNKIITVGTIIPSIELYTSNGELIFQHEIKYPALVANFEANYEKTKNSQNTIVGLYSDVYYFEDMLFLIYWERLDTQDRVNLDNMLVYQIKSKSVDLMKVYNFKNSTEENTLITKICIYNNNKLIAYNHLKNQFQFYNLN